MFEVVRCSVLALTNQAVYMAEADKTSSSRDPLLPQNAVEDIIVLDYIKHCDCRETTFNSNNISMFVNIFYSQG
jgi:hypothetical protein